MNIFKKLEGHVGRKHVYCMCGASMNFVQRERSVILYKCPNCLRTKAVVTSKNPYQEGDVIE